MIGAAAGAIPFFYPDANTGGTTVIQDIGNAISDPANGGNYMTLAGQNFIDGIWHNWPEVLGLGALAVGLGWAGKKFHVHKYTRVSKKWAVF